MSRRLKFNATPRISLWQLASSVRTLSTEWSTPRDWARTRAAWQSTSRQSTRSTTSYHSGHATPWAPKWWVKSSRLYIFTHYQCGFQGGYWVILAKMLRLKTCFFIEKLYCSTSLCRRLISYLFQIDGLEYFNTIVVQPHRKLVTNQGRGYHIRCRYQTKEKTLLSDFNVRYVQKLHWPDLIMNCTSKISCYIHQRSEWLESTSGDEIVIASQKG